MFPRRKSVFENKPDEEREEALNILNLDDNCCLNCYLIHIVMQLFYLSLVFPLYIHYIFYSKNQLRRYCLIPVISHIKEIIITAPNNILRTRPNSFSISRMAKN